MLRSKGGMRKTNESLRWRRSKELRNLCSKKRKDLDLLLRKMIYRGERSSKKPKSSGCKRRKSGDKKGSGKSSKSMRKRLSVLPSKRFREKKIESLKSSDSKKEKPRSSDRKDLPKKG
jgi:hypothetical protein